MDLRGGATGLNPEVGGPFVVTLMVVTIFLVFGTVLGPP